MMKTRGSKMNVKMRERKRRDVEIVKSSERLLEIAFWKESNKGLPEIMDLKV